MLAHIDAPAKWEASGLEEEYGNDVHGLEHDIKVNCVGIEEMEERGIFVICHLK